MKQKQVRRLMKAKKKMNRLANENLSDREIMDTFAYMLETYKRCEGAVNKVVEKSKNS